MLVRKHIEADQNRRNHEMELDSSLETSGTLSPDKDREGKVGSSSSPLRSAEKVNVDATRSMVAIRETRTTRNSNTTTMTTPTTSQSARMGHDGG